MDIANQSVLLRRRLARKYRRKLVFNRLRRAQVNEELSLFPRGPD